MATIPADKSATGYPLEIPDGPEQSINTEDAVGSPSGRAVFRVEVNGYNKLAPAPKAETTLPTMTVTAARQYPVKNPLLDYESYTYSLSLHGCSIEDYNNLVDNPDGYVPKQVLIAGAGRYGDTYPRNKYFQNTDFFFDDFKMTTYVNTTTRNKWSNLIECGFTIIEPLGFTFIKRMMMACMNEDGGIRSPNYLRQPFILQLDFFGYKFGEEANSYLTETLKDHTKYIPLILTEIKSRVTSKGTEYRVSAVPYNHTAFSPTLVVTPADFSVKAATVQDVFGKGFEVDPNLVAANEREIDFKSKNLTTTTGDASVAEYYANKPADTSKAFLDFGLCDKINSWNTALFRKTGRLPNKFRVEFDPIIGNSLIEAGQGADVSTVAESGTDKTATQQAAGAKKSTINFKNQTINIPAGTSMGAVVEWAITNSKWFQETNIFNDASAGSASKLGEDQRAAILNAFKIVPKVRVTEYDPGRADYSYEIVFQVKRWLANSKATNAPQGRTPGWVKEYNYFYSGGGISDATDMYTDNKDVIDLQIDFNMLYYTQLTAFKDKLAAQNTGGSLSEVNQSTLAELTTANTPSGRAVSLPRETTTNITPKQQNGIDGVGSTSDALTNFSVVTISKNARTTVARGSNMAAKIAAADIINSQLIDVAKGDMINVQLKIIGDPTFIKQDDIFYNSGISYATDILTKNNSLRTDDSELYVFLTFRTPTDYDESTGLAIPGQDKFAYTEFTGVYKIITIESQFSRGKFEQTLSLVRLTTSDEKLNVTLLNADRIESLLLAGTGQTARFPATLPFGPRIIQGTFSGGNALSGLATGLLSAGISAITNKIISEISLDVNSALTSIANNLANTLSGFFYDNSNGIPSDLSVVGSFSSDVADYVDIGVDAFGGAGDYLVDPFGGGGLI